MNYDRKCQLLIIGDSTVGKTSLLNYYKDGTFLKHYLATVGIDFFQKDVNFGEKKIRIKIWDTAGQERYKSLTEGYFRNAEGVLIVYDVTNSFTFENLKFWISSLKQHININKGHIPAIIIGNKIDILQREVTKEEGEKYAKQEGLEYYETSAKTGANVNEAINNLVKVILKNYIDNDNENEEKSFRIEGVKKSKNSTKEKKCCNTD